MRYWIIFVLHYSFQALALSPQAAVQKEKLLIGTLFTGDSFVTSYAKELKLYEAQGLDVEIVDFKSAMERDSAFRAMKIDGMTSDLVGSLLMKQSGHELVIVTQTLGRENVSRGVGILTHHKDLKITTEGLRGKKMALSFGNVIEFLAWQLLKNAGVDPNVIEYVQVPDIAMRLNLLLEKKVDLAIMPDPLASLAEVKGNRMILDDRERKISHAVLSFQKDIWEKKAPVVKRFLNAVNQVAEMVNKDSKGYKELIAKRCNVKDAALNDKFEYKYSVNTLPSYELYDLVQNWMLDRKLLKAKIPYETMIVNPYHAETKITSVAL